jgi:hypothetical protein
MFNPLHRMLLATALLPATALAAPPPGPDIRTEDATRFYAMYDAAGGKPSVTQLQQYLDDGTPGLAEFVTLRRVTAQRIAERIAADPAMYDKARQCLDELPAVRKRLVQVFVNLQRLYPDARFPPVTIAVGRGRPVGLTSPSGVLIGLEALCAADFMNPNAQDRFVQTARVDFEPNDPDNNVLRMSLVEGIAELVTELVSGEVGNGRHAQWTRGKEARIESAFALDLDSTNLTPWLYNYQPGSDEPYDLGYWVGYRIAKAYYLKADDKRAALRRLLLQDDPKAILEESGWAPGMWMPAKAPAPVDVPLFLHGSS